jgi:hypothetical protein
MNTPFSRGMSRVTELTKSGKLDEATTLIRSLLQPAQASRVQSPDLDIVEGTFTEVDDVAADDTAPIKSQPAPGTAQKLRTGLGETLRTIKAGGMPWHDRLTPVSVDLPPGA